MVVHSLGWGEAYRLGHHWVGEERLEQTILAGLERADPPVEPAATEWQTLTPAANATVGRAEGLALACGPEPAVEDVLVALIWQAGYGSWLLHELGVRPRRPGVAAGRGRSGCTAGRARAARPQTAETRRRAVRPPDGDHRRTPATPPEGSPFGFNLDHETRRAWIVVGEDVEAEPLVAGVLTAIRDK